MTYVLFYFYFELLDDTEENFLYIINIVYICLGAYGTVYKARDTVNDSIVAIKKVKLGLTEDGVPMQVRRFLITSSIFDIN